MNKKIFLPGMALFALLTFSYSLEAAPLTKKQFETFIRVMRTTLREPKTMAGIGIVTGVTVMCVAAYKLINRATATARGAEQLTTNAAETMGKIGQLLNPELLKNTEYRNIIASMLSEVISASIKTYLITSTELSRNNDKPITLIEILKDPAIQQLIKELAAIVTATYVKANAEADAAKSTLSAEEPGIIAQLLKNPAVVATLAYNFAAGLRAAPQAPTAPTTLVSAQPRPWFWTRWTNAAAPH